MLNKSDMLRQSLNAYIESHGCKAVWLSRQIGIDPSLLCRFRKNKRELWESTLKQIEQFLVEQGELK